MKGNQANRGQLRRLMYVENKDGLIDEYQARIGWVTFSKTGLSIYYRGRTFARTKGRGVSGNYHDIETSEEYWISGVKKRGSNVHPVESASVYIDEDARKEYETLRSTDDV